MKLRKDGRKKAGFRELSMNEKLRGEREFDCETSIGSHTLSTFPKGESKGAAYLTIALRDYGKQVCYAS